MVFYSVFFVASAQKKRFSAQVKFVLKSCVKTLDFKQATC